MECNYSLNGYVIIFPHMNDIGIYHIKEYIGNSKYTMDVIKKHDLIELTDIIWLEQLTTFDIIVSDIENYKMDAIKYKLRT